MKSTDLASTDPPVLQRQVPRMSGTEVIRQLINSDMDIESDGKSADRPQLACPIEEREVSDCEQDTTTADLEQALSEEQTYRETMRGIRSYMG